MQRDRTGRYVVSTVTGRRIRAFIPDPLPPEPAVDLAALQKPLAEALVEIGRLDSISTLLPDPDLFLYSYVRKEAVLSSQIEGTRSTLSHLLLFELGGVPAVPLDDVTEVSNYVAALDHGLTRLRSGFPLSNRLFREMHARLMASGRGREKAPGSFRRQQNWIGGLRPQDARFVPPPWTAVEDAMSGLETFIHGEHPTLAWPIRAGLAHVQFETIHPFLDGNGRVGRLLIPLMLCREGLLRQPALYLSLYFKERREEYYDQLDGVRRTGDWEEWLRFFLTGVAEVARGAVSTARRLFELLLRDQEQVQAARRALGSTLSAFLALRERPMASVPAMCRRTGLTFPTASAALSRLADLGIVEEITGLRRNRVFAYRRYLAILSEGADPL